MAKQSSLTKSRAEHCLGLLVRDCVFFQISVNVHLNIGERENGHLPLLKRTIRGRISSERWEQIKVAYVSGIGLRKIARKMNISEGTVLAHAKRHGWTQQIQVATQQQSDAITPMQSVPQSLVAILSELKEMSKYHNNLIRTVTRAGFAYPVRVSRMATTAGVICVEAGVRNGDDQHAVAVNVDGVRSRPAPGEVHPMLSLHFVATRTERDLARRGCRCSRGSHSRGGRCDRSRSGRWRWCRR